MREDVRAVLAFFYHLFYAIELTDDSIQAADLFAMVRVLCAATGTSGLLHKYTIYPIGVYVKAQCRGEIGHPSYWLLLKRLGFVIERLLLGFSEVIIETFSVCAARCYDDCTYIRVVL